MEQLSNIAVRRPPSPSFVIHTSPGSPRALFKRVSTHKRSEISHFLPPSQPAYAGKNKQLQLYNPQCRTSATPVAPLSYLPLQTPTRLPFSGYSPSYPSSTSEGRKVLPPLPGAHVIDDPARDRLLVLLRDLAKLNIEPARALQVVYGTDTQQHEYRRQLHDYLVQQHEYVRQQHEYVRQQHEYLKLYARGSSVTTVVCALLILGCIWALVAWVNRTHTP